MKNSVLYIIFILVFSIVACQAQTSHRMLTSLGAAHFPFLKESASRNDETFKKSWTVYCLSLGYAVDKWPIELVFSMGTRNKKLGEFERDVIYHLDGQPEISELSSNYNIMRINYGLNFYLFRHNADLIMEEPSSSAAINASINRKRRIINPFVGVGVSYTRFQSYFNMETLDFNLEDENGSRRNFSFGSYEKSKIYYSFGFESELFSERTNAEVQYPSWKALTYFFRYTALYQNLPNIFTHTNSTLGQDFLDNYQPYMDSYNLGQMIIVPFNNWSHYFEIALVATLNYKASKKLKENIKSLKENDNDNETEIIY